jgi:hypothetical protein
MTRPRHAMRVNPLRSPGVIVGVPVAAAVAFGAHAVLGILPVADQQGTPTASSAPSAAPAAAPVQGYGLATAPPPTTLGLLSAPGTDPGPTSGSGATTVPIAGSSAAHHTGAAHTVPITRPAAAPAPSMMTFSPSHAAPAPAAPAPAAPVAPAAAPAAVAPPQAAAAPAPQTVQRAAAPQATPAQDDGGSSDQGSSGGSLVDVDLGVAKVSLLSFGD